MNVSGEFTIKAPRAAVFDTIRDPKSFISLVDGIRDLKEIDPTHYEAVFETKIAYLNFKFKVSVEVTQARGRRDRRQDRRHAARRRRPPDRDTSTTLTEAGDETKVAYSVDVDARRQARQHGPAGDAVQSQGHGKEFVSRLRERFAQSRSGVKHDAV